MNCMSRKPLPRRCWRCLRQQQLWPSLCSARKPRARKATVRAARARGHGAEGGKILLQQQCRGLRHHDGARGDAGAPRAAGLESVGNSGRCRRRRDRRPAAGAADAARGRHDHGAGAGRGRSSPLRRRRSARSPAAKGDALFTIIARSEYDLIGMVPVKDIAKLAGRPAGADQDHRRRRSRRPRAPHCADHRAEQPARPGLHRHHAGAALPGQCLRARADQDRAELRHRRAADLDPLRHRPAPWCRWCAARGSRRGGSRSG